MHFRILRAVHRGKEDVGRLSVLEEDEGAFQLPLLLHAAVFPFHGERVGFRVFIYSPLACRLWNVP